MIKGHTHYTYLYNGGRIIIHYILRLLSHIYLRIILLCMRLLTATIQNYNLSTIISYNSLPNTSVEKGKLF